MNLAGKYSNFLSPDLIDFGQKGSKSFQNFPYQANETGFENRLLDIYERQMTPEHRQALMEDQLKFQGKQMEKAYPYLLARQIPETISQAFGLANQMRLRGGELGTAAALRGVDAVAQGRFAPYGALPEFSYFS